MRKLKESTVANTVILALVTEQKTAHSEEIDFTGPHMPTDDELKEMIILAKTFELKLIRDCQVVIELAEERGEVTTISEVGIRWDGKNDIAAKNNT